MSDVNRHQWPVICPDATYVIASDYDSAMKEAACQADLLRLAAEQYRDEREKWHQLCVEAQVQRDDYQGQRDAALKQVEGLSSLLAECRTTFEMWKDVAPAISLCADLDAALQAKS